MPNQSEIRWSQLKVGVLVLVAIVSLVALVFLMTGTSGGFFTHRITVHSFFNNAAGLQTGAPVNLQGVTIGSVTKITLVPERKETPVEVTMKIGVDHQKGLHTDSQASLTTAGLLGNTFVDIDSSQAKGPELQNGAELPAVQAPSLADVIKSSEGTIQQVNTILSQVSNIVDSVNNGKGTIGKFFKDPTLYDHAVKTVAEAQTLVNGINQGKGTLGKFVTDDVFYKNANKTMAEMQHIVDEVNNGNGTVGKLVKDPALYNNMNSLVAGINQGQGTLGMLVKDQAFRNKLNLTVGDMQTILNGVNQGQGTVGKLMKDPSLYNNSDTMMVEVRDLIRAIRKNPKKYLTIHLKIF